MTGHWEIMGLLNIQNRLMPSGMFPLKKLLQRLENSQDVRSSGEAYQVLFWVQRSMTLDHVAMEIGELIIYTSLKSQPTKTSFLWMNSYRIRIRSFITLECPALSWSNHSASPYVGEPHTCQPTVVTWLLHHLRQLFWDKLNEAGIDTYAVGKIVTISSTELVSTTIWATNKSNSYGMDTD